LKRSYERGSFVTVAKIYPVVNDLAITETNRCIWYGAQSHRHLRTHS